jgi:serine/threonine protein kinase
MSDPRDPAGMLGRQLGKYVIEEPLGLGGMGQVFRARHVELQRLVALKLMHAQMAQDPAFQARFREARAAAALAHPHIVAIYDFDEADGFAYLVMELLTGGTFRRLLREGSSLDPHWSLARGLELIAQAAEALAYAHMRGMVHRDIKPENLLLQPNVAGGFTLKVGDFGLAHLAEPGGSLITQTGVTMGTLAYMAPEQASGAELDGRADQYALGVVLYELACGVLPFEARTVAEAIYKHVHTPPTPPHQHRPELPEALDALILRCLGKLPVERFASCADLALALRRLSGSVSPSLEVPSILVGGGTSQLGTLMRSRADRPAPEAQSLAGASNLPRIQVLDQAGTLQQVVVLRQGGMSVGRASGNDIWLEAPSVSRHHVQVSWDGLRVTVTDLGARSGSELNGVRLAPQEPAEWAWGTLLRVGPYWLRLEAPAARQARQIGAGGRGAPPLLVLKGFARIALAPGERGTVRFALPAAELRYLGLDLEPVFEPGTIEVFVGPSADRARLRAVSVELIAG